MYQCWWVSNTNKDHPYNPTVSTNLLLLLLNVQFWLCWRCCRYICFLTACFSRTVSTSFLCLRLDLSGLLNIRKRKARNLTLIILQSVRSPPHLVVTSPWGDDGPLVECLSDFELCCRRTLTFVAFCVCCVGFGSTWLPLMWKTIPLLPDFYKECAIMWMKSITYYLIPIPFAEDINTRFNRKYTIHTGIQNT